MAKIEDIGCEIDALEKKFNKFRTIMFSDSVTKEYLQSIDVGETVLVKGVELTKVHGGEYCMQFISKIPPNGEFPMHWHNVFELNLILKGQITNSGITYLQGHIVKIKKDLPHEFVNQSSTEATVISTTFTDFETTYT